MKILLSALLTLLVFGASAAEKPVKLLVLGDSLTAGYGIELEEAFPAQLERKLRAEGHEAATVINAGVSGDTTAGGRARLEWALAEKPDTVILALGANDMLRGIPPETTQANLEAMLKQLQARKVDVLLAGMKAPLNLGLDYAGKFNGIYPVLAKKYGVLLYPFFLEGVAADPSLNQPDGLHPTPEGVKVMVEKIYPAVEELVEKAGR